MHVLMTGAAGMLGQKLARALAGSGPVRGVGGGPPEDVPAVTRLSLVDITRPATEGLDGAVTVTAQATNLTDPGAAEALADLDPDIVVHMAAIVSAEAEADFAKGYAVNLDATRALFFALADRRARRASPTRVVFASSLAVFGGPFPAEVPDDFAPVPLSSYGIQKLIGEALLRDLTRRGLIDGVALRLPTICVRPGVANRAASGFYSAILREPLAGKRARLPVSDDLRHYFASPRAATGFFLHAMSLPASSLGGDPVLTLPGLSASVGELIAALRDVAGAEAVARIDRVPDPAIQAIVETWATGYSATRARALGFRAETAPDALLRVYLEDDAPAAGA